MTNIQTTSGGSVSRINNNNFGEMPRARKKWDAAAQSALKNIGQKDGWEAELVAKN